MKSLVNRQDLVRLWLKGYQDAIRTGDSNEGLRYFSHDATFIGTRVNFSRTTREHAENQWGPIWRASHNFEFLELLTVMDSGSLAYCAVLWRNTTKIEGHEVERFGRATFVFKIENAMVIAIHSHFSESPPIHANVSS